MTRLRAFCDQRIGSRLCRCEQPAADQINDPAIILLGPGGIKIAGAQTGLDMANRDLFVKGCHRRCHRRRRVALNEHRIGPMRGKHIAQSLHHRNRDIGQRLPHFHDVKVDIGCDRKGE